jgi:hypothetical protein
MVRMAIYKKILGVSWRCLYNIDFFKKTCRMHALKLLVEKIPLLKNVEIITYDKLITKITRKT